MPTDALRAAARDLAVRTAKTIRQPVEHIVRRPRTQRYFLKSLRVSHPSATDDERREAIGELEFSFPPPEVTEAVEDPIWWRRVRRLMRSFPPRKLHALIERTRRHFGWHHELTINVLMVAELQGRVTFDDPYWKRPDPENQEVAMVVSQSGTRRKAPAIRVVPVQKLLPCPLTERERMAALEQSGSLWSEVDSLDAELREHTKAQKAQIRAKRAELEQLMKRVRDKVDNRAVRCEERYIYETGRVRVIRLDTGAVIEERPMKAEERQLVLGAGASSGAARSSSAP